MTQEELSDLALLDILFKQKQTEFSFKELSALFKGLVDDTRATIDDLIKRNILHSAYYVDFLDDKQRFKKHIGARNRYIFLKKKKRAENLGSVLLWTAAMAGIISAIYGGITYHATNDTNKKPPLKTRLQQEQQKATPVQTLEPDTIRVPQNKTDSLSTKASQKN